MDPLLQEKSQSTKAIAQWLLISFIISIALLFVMNVIIFLVFKNDKSDEHVKNWFELLKNALILLGTSLTTIIGYYFGQRSAEQAEKKANLLQKENEKAEDAVNGYMEQLKELKQTLNTITVKDDDEILNQPSRTL